MDGYFYYEGGILKHYRTPGSKNGYHKGILWNRDLVADDDYNARERNRSYYRPANMRNASYNVNLPSVRNDTNANVPGLYNPKKIELDTRLSTGSQMSQLELAKKQEEHDKRAKDKWATLTPGQKAILSKNPYYDPGHVSKKYSIWDAMDDDAIESNRDKIARKKGVSRDAVSDLDVAKAMDKDMDKTLREIGSSYTAPSPGTNPEFLNPKINRPGKMMEYDQGGSLLQRAGRYFDKLARKARAKRNGDLLLKKLRSGQY